ncbi:PEP-utilizing enzyme [Umezawaea endophytica]|uniref:PEP-utilizing enzyme n=1 Tax=Umezawaea endophytica TaxID=1654476 RepID=A0A9X2VI07_9PSEU|nr:PEP-utilizing enzyme [Umezawaea endophytica]MCS7477021.1 PEP-utilizing enzyme [Umezawaea endophytica]
MKAPLVRLGTKAETLRRLRPLMTTARVLPLMHFTLREWQDGPDRLLAELRGHGWAAGPVMVRSSAMTEDTGTDSNAGRFRSVPARSEAEVVPALTEVFASYGRADADDQILIQPLLEHVQASGVAFSCDPNSGAPYRVVNWSGTDQTDAVTGGGQTELHISYGAAWAGQDEAPDPRVGAVWALLTELHGLLGERQRLDIEFAFSDRGELILLQVRPLAVRKAVLAVDTHRATLSDTAARMAEAIRPRSRVLGHRAVFGVMPDWNPAEMIGLRPRPLALSLYRHLVTDRVWAAARTRYGYRDMTGVRLMVEFSGLPYIDVAASLTSFVPREVPDDLADRLVGHWLDELVAKPYLHDKIESHIAVSAWTFSTRHRLEALTAAGFSAGERDQLAGSLRGLTNDLVRGPLWEQDVARLGLLNVIDIGHLHAAGCGAHDVGCCGPALVAQLDVCASYGSGPFAALARAAFIATDFLEDLVDEGILSLDDRARFIGGLGLVASEMRRDLAELDRPDFLKRYGHLRPGTYDILSPRYDETPERYFDWSAKDSLKPVPHGEEPPFELSGGQRRRVEALLVREGLKFDASRLMDFLATAIRGREHGKLAFTSVLSDVLTGARRLGERSGHGVDDLSHLDVRTLGALTGRPGDDGPVLRAAVTRGREAHAVSRTVVLPPLVTDPANVRSFALPQIRPNFVTQGRVTARVARIDAGDSPDGAIVLVASADPGYDWLFTRGISGLVTAFGGANSHMAIRALELGIPAVIGAGAALFDQWSQAHVLELDAAGGLVTVIA